MTRRATGGRTGAKARRPVGRTGSSRTPRLRVEAANTHSLRLHDPVVAGFADDLAHPRGNMTGLTFMAAEFNGKRLEILRDIVPGLRRVAIIANPEHPGSQLERTYSEEAARRLGLEIEFFATATQDQLTTALDAMDPHPPQAISLFADGFLLSRIDRGSSTSE